MTSGARRKRKLALDAIERNPILKVRLIDEAKVRQYARLVREGTVMDPVDVFEVDGALLLVNGWHRFDAHKLAGKDSIAAEVHQGDMSAAMEFAAFANAKNALPLNKLGQRGAVKLALLSDAFERRSEREMAAHPPCQR